MFTTTLKNILMSAIEMRRLGRLIPIIVLIVLTVHACSSKYGPRLHTVSEEGRTGVRPSEMFYVENMGVGSPLVEAYMVPAAGHLAAMSYSVKDTGTLSGEGQGVLQYRRRIDYRMLLPLPAKLAPGAVTLDNSFVRDFSNIETPLAARTFLFSGGTFSVDSIKSADLYTSINAVFRSLKGDSLKYEGQMRFVPRDRFYFRGVIYRRQK
jgi:hypothetical protein